MKLGNFNIDRYFSGDASIFEICRTEKFNNKFIIDLNQNCHFRFINVKQMGVC